jgi:hypothetical protein
MTDDSIIRKPYPLPPPDKTRADGVTSRTTEAIIAAPGFNRGVPSLGTGLTIRPDRKEGPIFIEPQIIKKTFFGRK